MDYVIPSRVSLPVALDWACLRFKATGIEAEHALTTTRGLYLYIRLCHDAGCITMRDSVYVIIPSYGSAGSLRCVHGRRDTRLADLATIQGAGLLLHVIVSTSLPLRRFLKVRAMSRLRPYLPAEEDSPTVSTTPEQPINQAQQTIQQRGRAETIRVVSSIGIILILLILLISYPRSDAVWVIPNLAHNIGMGPPFWIIVIPGLIRIPLLTGMEVEPARIAISLVALIGWMVVMLTFAAFLSRFRIVHRAIPSSDRQWRYLRIRVPRSTDLEPTATISFLSSVISSLAPSQDDASAHVILSLVSRPQQPVQQGVVIAADDPIARTIAPTIESIGSGVEADDSESHPFWESPAHPWLAVIDLALSLPPGAIIAPITDPMGVQLASIVITTLRRVSSGSAGLLIGIARPRDDLAQLTAQAARETAMNEGLRERDLDRSRPTLSSLVRVVVRVFARDESEEAAKQTASLIADSISRVDVALGDAVGTWKPRWDVVINTETTPLAPIQTAWYHRGWVMAGMTILGALGVLASVWLNGIGMVAAIGGTVLCFAGGLFIVIHTYRSLMDHLAHHVVRLFLMDPPKEPVVVPWWIRIWRRY